MGIQSEYSVTIEAIASHSPRLIEIHSQYELLEAISLLVEEFDEP
jgi:hypothetical protein